MTAQKIPIEKLCRLVVSGGTPNRKHPEYFGGGIPWVKTMDLDDTSIRSTNETLTDVGLSRSSAKLLPENTTLIAMYGATVGKMGYLKSPAACNQAACALIPDPEKADPRWLFYCLLNARERLVGLASGAAQQNLNLFTVKEFLLPHLGLTEQRAVAEVLGTLDDKIAANKTTIRKTSELSQALTNSVLRDVGETNIGRVSSAITRGSAPKYAEIGFTVLNQKCVRNGRVDTSHGRISSKLPKNQEKILASEDILINSTGQGTLGRVARWTRRDQEVSVDSHVTIVRIDPNKADPTFVGTCLLSKEKAIEALAEGSTGQTELRKESIAALPLRLPSLDIQRQVGTDLSELAVLADALEDESRALAATRDELLPLLMSGKITVRDAEKRVEKEV